ncbi:uncharacterized protein A1O5_08224 [Cladophialophora psammophila CBS 110553]|uniref:Transcription factor domain-containing protein n=1 Tax=Cladophialophora psammophila CBS 110553 TaxID=1182543 RepID=W9WJX4_9EURO|nr:uncharacterized protein A1O5_08224 [Cladophialophora psammophila CBS 110553]EXJ68432.1 hypothetical protein A1O5_08224 [Cladophialophora psammophila CBS 110553]
MDFESLLSRVWKANHPLHRLGQGFSVLDSFDSSPKSSDLQLALRGLSLYTLAVDDYLAARSVAPSLAVLEDLRCFVMHGILALTPPDLLSDPCPQPGADEVLYICQLAALTYGMLCIFPLPAAPFELLANRIKQSLSRHDFTKAWAEAPRLMLWITFVAAIASSGLTNNVTRSWFVCTIGRCLRKLRIESWTALKDDVLLEFLWLPATNDADGIDLWAEIVEASTSFVVGGGCVS